MWKITHSHEMLTVGDRSTNSVFYALLVRILIWQHEVLSQKYRHINVYSSKYTTIKEKITLTLNFKTPIHQKQKQKTL